MVSFFPREGLRSWRIPFRGPRDKYLLIRSSSLKRGGTNERGNQNALLGIIILVPWILLSFVPAYRLAAVLQSINEMLVTAVETSTGRIELSVPTSSAHTFDIVQRVCVRGGYE